MGSHCRPVQNKGNRYARKYARTYTAIDDDGNICKLTYVHLFQCVYNYIKISQQTANKQGGYSNTMHACDVVVRSVLSGIGGGGTDHCTEAGGEGPREGHRPRSVVFWDRTHIEKSGDTNLTVLFGNLRWTYPDTTKVERAQT